MRGFERAEEGRVNDLGNGGNGGVSTQVLRCSANCVCEETGLHTGSETKHSRNELRGRLVSALQPGRPPITVRSRPGTSWKIVSTYEPKI
eukprot:946367-Pyramimonas_sp.AAC.2